MVYTGDMIGADVDQAQPEKSCAVLLDGRIALGRWETCRLCSLSAS